MEKFPWFLKRIYSGAATGDSLHEMSNSVFWEK